MKIPVSLHNRGIEVYAETVERYLDRLYLCSLYNPDKVFEKLYEVLNWPRLVAVAAIKILGNSGAYTPGVDGITKGVFLRTFEKQIEEICKELKSADGYKPTAIYRVFIPKKDGSKRPLGIATIRDRIVQECIRMILEAIYEPLFSDKSHGFRPGHSVQDCRQDVMAYLYPNKKTQYVLEGDIKAFFDNVDHGILNNLIGKKIHDRKFRTLVYRFLKAEILENGNRISARKGTPQGGVISPLLSNIYLNEFDKFIKELTEKNSTPVWSKRDGHTRARKPDGGTIGYVRYADDWVILWNGSKANLVIIRDRITKFLKDNLKLELSLEKTLLTDVEKNFKFVGFNFRKSKVSISMKKDGERYKIVLYPYCTFPFESLKKCFENVNKVLREAKWKDLELKLVVLKINQIISGFMNHFADITHIGKLVNIVQFRLNRMFYLFLRHIGKNPRRYMIWVHGRPTYRVGKYILRYEPTREPSRLTNVKRGLCEAKHGSRFLERCSKDKCGRHFTNDPIVPLKGDWRELRLEILKRDGSTCVYCGKKATEVHHKFTEEESRHDLKIKRLRNKKPYLVSICTRCHKTKHGKVWSWDSVMEYIEKTNKCDADVAV